jgi:hypothetical protein
MVELLYDPHHENHTIETVFIVSSSAKFVSCDSPYLTARCARTAPWSVSVCENDLKVCRL